MLPGGDQQRDDDAGCSEPGSGEVRGDLTLADFPLLTCGVMATMYFKPGGNSDWRRHLEFVLDGIRILGNRRGASA